MLVPSAPMLVQARAGGYAIGHFNTYDLESTLGIIEAAEALSSPVIVAVSEKTAEYAGLEAISSIVAQAAKRADVPVALHLDHGQSEAIIEQAVTHGFTSVMFDGSHLPYAENLERTKTIVEKLHGRGISVEAETGRIGGKEDFVAGKTRLTTSEEAENFVKETEVDILAPALGTAHGTPLIGEKIHLELLNHIAQRVTVPLALHGASNIPRDDIQAAIKHGISKINIDTELREAFSTAVRSALRDRSVVDPREYLQAGREAIVETVKRKILEFGSVGKA